MAIRVLPPLVAARIAAGEVVERPASVVKELVENALDAGASSVEVVLRGDGLASICVSDDGAGMPPEDLALALCRHATSKLVDDDLLKVGTLGFRGEALPSMAAVATVRISSRPKGQDVAFGVMATDGKASTPRPCAGGYGTRVEVGDLFSLHPARLKFLKSGRAETAAAKEAVQALALSRPDVAFRFTANGNAAHYPARRTLVERAADVLGPEFRSDSIPVSWSEGAIAVEGLACLPSATRSDASGMRFLVNGRPVSDRTMRAAVLSAYAKAIGSGRYPRAVISVTLPPGAVDVNVHPRKAEVRFSRPAEVASAVASAVGAALDGSGLRTPSALADMARRLAVAADPGDGDRRRLPLGRFLGQANGSWIVAETAAGIVIIDQHAAHERVVMERLRQASEGSVGETRYPSPRWADVTPSEAAAVHDAAPVLRSMGFDARAGDSSVELLAVPSVLSGCDPDGLLELVVRCASEGAESGLLGEALWERLATAACKAAIKAGQELTPERADALLREIEATPNASWCNHGRPTAAFLDNEAIARLFARG